MRGGGGEGEKEGGGGGGGGEGGGGGGGGGGGKMRGKGTVEEKVRSEGWATTGDDGSLVYASTPLAAR